MINKKPMIDKCRSSAMPNSNRKRSKRRARAKQHAQQPQEQQRHETRRNVANDEQEESTQDWGQNADITAAARDPVQGGTNADATDDYAPEEYDDQSGFHSQVQGKRKADGYYQVRHMHAKKAK